MATGPLVGFVILSHNNPPQLWRLVRRLVEMFGSPPIVCHHDFGQTELGALEFPAEVSFVKPHVATKWAHISIIYAFLRALDHLYARPDSPEWFMLISAADYPVKGRSMIESDLLRGGYDAFLDHRRLVYPPASFNTGTDWIYDDPDWSRHAYDLYLSYKIRIPSLTRRLKLTDREVVIRSPWVVNMMTPFQNDFRCFAGDTWFSGNRRAARVLLENSPQRAAALAYFQKKWVPEEAVFQTVLCNAPGLRISKKHKRYADWSKWCSHPETLGRADISAVLTSGAHFARKFDVGADPAVLDEIDAQVDAIEQNSPGVKL